MLVVRKKGYLDHLTVRVEAKREVYDAGPDKCAEVEKNIGSRIKGLLGFSAAIQVVEPKLIERPILVSDTRAVIGRPTENLLKLVD